MSDNLISKESLPKNINKIKLFSSSMDQFRNFVPKESWK